MTELPTVSLDTPRTPRRRSRETGALFSLTIAGGLLLVGAAAPTAAPWYGWAAFAVVAVFSGTLAVVDERTMRLPNRLVASLACFGLIQAFGASLAAHSLAPLGAAAACAAALGLAYISLAMIGSCGAGDAKFAAALALSIAPFIGLVALYILPVAFLVSAVRVVARRLQGHADRHPHGLSIAIAGLGLMATALAAGASFMA